MRNQANVPDLRSDKRFDALVKQQMIEHQHAISCHNKEMQTLRDSLQLAIEKFESLSGHNMNELEEFRIHTSNFICFLKDKLHGNQTAIEEQSKTIQALHDQSLDFQSIYSTKKDIEKLKKDFGAEIKANTISHINAFQEFQMEFKTIIHSLEKDLLKLRCELEKKISELTDDSEKNFSVSRIDKDGVLKQIRVYEKTILIMEKKIENIYTLIERINARGKACHKPE